MTTFTVNIEDQESEKVLKAFFDALEINYEVSIRGRMEDQNSNFSEKDEELFNRLKSALKEIKKWEHGEVKLNDAKTFIVPF